MLIISKFHDYYDTAIAYGVDKDCVYERTTKDINVSRYRYNDVTEFNTKDNRFQFKEHTIGFAGSIYRCVVVEKCTHQPNTKKQLLAFYDAESLIDYLKKHDIGLKNKGISRWGWGNMYRSEVNIKNYFDKEIKQNTYDIFRDNHTPIFVINKNKTVLNPCLKDFKFGKIKDAVTAFQEIYQYLTGVLGNIEKDTADIPDKIRVQQHGFNDWSFKKLPGQKKRKKKRN